MAGEKVEKRGPLLELELGKREVEMLVDTRAL